MYLRESFLSRLGGNNGQYVRERGANHLAKTFLPNMLETVECPLRRFERKDLLTFSD